MKDEHPDAKELISEAMKLHSKNTIQALELVALRKHLTQQNKVLLRDFLQTAGLQLELISEKLIQRGQRDLPVSQEVSELSEPNSKLLGQTPVNPESHYRYYLITLPKDGAELVLGNLEEDFVRHWIKFNGGEELSDFLSDPFSQDDEVIPKMTEWGNVEWSEIDHLEHHHGVISDGQYSVQEIMWDNDPQSPFEEITSLEKLQAETVRKSEKAAFPLGNIIRRARNHEICNTKVEKSTPALMFYAQERGYFGSILIKTTGDFDPDSFFVETIMASGAPQLVERFFYYTKGREYEPLELFPFDETSTQTIASGARVGFINEDQ